MNNTIAQLSGEEIYRFLDDRSDLDFVNLVTALDRLARESRTAQNRRDPRLQQLLGSLRRALDDPNSLKRPRHISNTLWALSQLQIADPPLLGSIATVALASMDRFEPHSLSSTACAMAKLKWQPSPLWEAVSLRAMQRLPEFDSRGLSNTAWSVAALR